MSDNEKIVMPEQVLEFDGDAMSTESEVTGLIWGSVALISVLTMLNGQY